MRNSLSIIFFLLFSFSHLHANAIEAEKKVIVDLELESMPNTLKYEIEVKKTSEVNEKAVPFSQKNPNFKLKLKVGNYVVRTRVVTTDSQVSEWSDWSELLVKPEEVALDEIKEPTLSLQKNQSQAQLDLNWKRADGADKYIVVIENLETKKLTKKESTSNQIKLPLAKGEYKIGIQSISKEGMKSETRFFKESVYVADANLPQIELSQPTKTQFKWKKQKLSAVQIEILRKPFFADSYQLVNSLKQETDEWSLPKDLMPGEYKIQFQYISDFYQSGPKKEMTFIKKPVESDFPSELKN